MQSHHIFFDIKYVFVDSYGHWLLVVRSWRVDVMVRTYSLQPIDLSSTLFVKSCQKTLKRVYIASLLDRASPKLDFWMELHCFRLVIII